MTNKAIEEIQGYLNMQQRRRRQKPPGKTPSGDIVKAPAEYWEELNGRDLDTICDNALAGTYPPDGILLPFLGGDLLVDIKHRRVSRLKNGRRESIEDSLLELLCLVYLLNVGPEPLSQDMIGVHDLKDAHFFQGPHELKVRPLLERYGNDLDGFKMAAERLGGRALNLADAAYKISPFPKAPVYYLLWKGDQEFEPRLAILFDRSIEHHLSADAIWGLVNLVSDILLMGEQGEGWV
ncbi:MAG: DUF3786 domain-containing protein [Desulfobacterales bacterium]|nr:DUF3786 domain-containing protein [Desulfobacterales bacterium]